jgi:1,4-dihydroxy-2-naphthoate octaprenyltransferase
MTNVLNDKTRIRNVLLHLRLPFSYFLLPVFAFGLSQSVSIDIMNSIIIFMALHFFIYPASNSYNSFMDQDTGSIGALKHPPPATKDLYYTSILLDLIGIIMTLFIDISMIFFISVYIMVSKAYSWNKTRLKKYPFMGWLAVILFQGGYTFFLVNISAENNFSPGWLNSQKAEAMLLSTLLIGAYYPLTQIYQHKEDFNRGDLTISYKLGINGTFIFSALMFLLSFVFSFFYFKEFYSVNQFSIFLICLLPAILYFLTWFIRTLKNRDQADFQSTMRMTFISSTCLLIAFTVLLFLNHFSYRL